MFEITQLPDDCLNIIFKCIRNLDDLVNCYKVCQRWKFLVGQRLQKVRYLTDDSNIEGLGNGLYFNQPDTLREVKILGLLPNFKILDIRPTNETKFKSIDVFKSIENVDSLKGLIYEPCWDKFPCSIPKVLTLNLEMIATSLFEPSFVQCYHKIANLKQLYFGNCFQSHFEQIVNSGYLQNLHRLHIQSRNFSISSYDGAILESLKILEACLYSYDATDPYPGFHFMDLCPSVESAYHLIKAKKLSINENIKNNYLKNLVLDHPENYSSSNWEDLRILLIKYPNLENLAIRGDYGLTDDNLSELIEQLPRIIILDLRQSARLTDKSIDYVKHYCQRKNRTIYFYSRPNQRIENDWPQLSLRTNQRICRGFDFMTNCFLKSFQQLPYLMDPY